jgi:hypothetical protein
MLAFIRRCLTCVGVWLLLLLLLLLPLLLLLLLLLLLAAGGRGPTHGAPGPAPVG